MLLLLTHDEEESLAGRKFNPSPCLGFEASNLTYASLNVTATPIWELINWFRGCHNGSAKLTRDRANSAWNQAGMGEPDD